jgi:hypothetical protein
MATEFQKRAARNRATVRDAGPPSDRQHRIIEGLLFDLETEATAPATYGEARRLIANLRRRLALSRA